MATTKQRKVAKLIIENATLDKPLNGGEMLAKVGYAKSMHRAKVNDVLESEGVREALNDYGFNEDNAKKVVASILLKEKAQDKDRLKAADMIFEVHGSKAPTKSVSVSLDLKPEQMGDAEKIREEYEERLRAQLLQ